MPEAVRPVKIIAVGDELLEGRTVDTNSRHIQRALGSHAVRCRLGQVVPDELDAIAEALDRTEASDLVFLTGGLGSTPDDLTRDAVAAWGGLALNEDSDVRAQLSARWRARGVKSRPGIERQCQVPEGMTALTNPVGSAPGLVGTVRGRTLVLLPGVPAEMEGLLPLALAWLREQGRLPTGRAARVWRTAQIAELAMVRRCAALHEAHTALHWSWWLTDWGVDLRLAANRESASELATVAPELDGVLGHFVYARDETTLPATVQAMLTGRGQTLAVAESCTGGLIGGALTATPGSSVFFRGGVQAYADAVKTSQLGVAGADLDAHGAVSAPVVAAMATGCRNRIGTDYGLAVSGISGPDGGTADKPVGTTFVAIATPKTVHVGRYRFPADRHRNRLLTVAAAIDSLRRVLQTEDGASPWHGDDTWCRP